MSHLVGVKTRAGQHGAPREQRITLMKVLVTGATGTVGSRLVRRLIDDGVEVRALTRSPESTQLPAGVETVRGDLLQVDVLRAAMRGVDAMFLLSAVVAEELVGTLTTLNLAREVGLKGLVYLSVYQGELFSDVPHESAKYAAERMIADRDLPATVLRPAYFMQNDLRLKDVIAGNGVYPSPIGAKGVSTIDVDDIAEVAALELVRRAEASDPLDRKVYDLVGPDVLTGENIAAIWSEVLGRPVAAAGDVDRTFEMMRTQAPAWMAYAIRQMFVRFAEDGMAATPQGLSELSRRLGRPPRSYRRFAEQAARTWSKAAA